MSEVFTLLYLVERIFSSFSWVFLKEICQKFLHFFIFYKFWKSQVALFYWCVNRVWVILVCLSKRKLETEELVKNAAQGPQINLERISISFENFRSHVVWSSNNCESFEEILRIEFLCGSHIDQVNFSFWVNNWVFRFEIPVNNVVGVKILNGEKKTPKIVLDHFWIHGLDFSDDIEHLFSVNIFHYKIDILFVMEIFDKAHNIRKYDLFQNTFLRDHWLLHLFLLDVLLTQTFYSEKVGSKLNVFCKVDLSELTLS